MANDGLCVGRTDGVMEITLDRPAKLNALDETACRALQRVLADAASPDVRAVLLTGNGRGFCTGQDLGERMAVLRGEPVDLGASLARNWNPVVGAIRDLAKPVVAAVNGVAAGAGANLALACDIVVAARSATFVQSFVRVGLVPDAGGTYHLPRLIGTARAKAAMMLGDPISAEQAEAWGMIWKAVDDDRLLPEARDIASRLARQPTFALGLCKQALRSSGTNTGDEQLALEAGLQRRAGYSSDYAEGLRAFIEKRPAQFTGLPPRDDRES